MIDEATTGAGHRSPEPPLRRSGATVPAADGERARDVEAIREVWQRLAAAWGRADASGTACAWLPDGDHRSLVSNGKVRCGRDELQKAWGQLFTRRSGGASPRLAIDLQACRFLRADVAIVDGVLDVTAIPRSRSYRDGRAMSGFTAAMVREDGQWRIAASRLGPLTAPPALGRRRVHADTAELAAVDSH